MSVAGGQNAMNGVARKIKQKIWCLSKPLSLFTCTVVSILFRFPLFFPYSSERTATHSERVSNCFSHIYWKQLYTAVGNTNNCVFFTAFYTEQFRFRHYEKRQVCSRMAWYDVQWMLNAKLLIRACIIIIKLSNDNATILTHTCSFRMPQPKANTQSIVFYTIFSCTNVIIVARGRECTIVLTHDI